MSEEFKKRTEEFDVKHIKVANGSPQAKGQVEIVNRTLGPMLAKLSDAEIGKYWVKCVNDVEFALNNAVHSSKKEIPSTLLFGVAQRGKVQDPVAEFVMEDVYKQKRSLDSIRSKSNKQIVKQQQKEKEQANKNRKQAREYESGYYVMLKNVDSTTEIFSKLKPKI